MNDTDDLWISCADALREQVSDAIWQAYLSGITPVSIKEHEIVLGVPNKLIRDRVESRFLGLIQDTVTGTARSRSGRPPGGGGTVGRAGALRRWPPPT